MSDQGSSLPIDQTEAFVRLFSRYTPQLRAYIVALTLDPSDADEVFQNTSCKLWQKFASFDPETSFMAWACRVAYFECKNYRRVKSRRPVLSDEVLQAVAAEAEGQLSSADTRRAALVECVDGLGSPERQLLRLRYYDQKSVADIAGSLTTSAHTVYRRLNRVYDLLLSCIRTRLASG